MRIVARHVQPRIDEALDNFRAVVLHGARQCGKSTLARLVADGRRGTYTSLDDDASWLRDRMDSVSPGAFRAGILLHTGHQQLTVGDRLHVCPIDTLWQ